MTEKKWILKPLDSNKIKQISETLSIPLPIANIMYQRGIDSKEKAAKYFSPKVQDLHSPFLMKDIEKATERINQAILKKEKILIYGDYDVDGTTSVAMMYLFLSKLYDNIEYYIPDRYSEGYGVSQKGIMYAIDNNFKLIVALDCGTKAINEIELASLNNVDVIVCDHHTPGEVLPKAYAILNPKQADCNYPFKELSGCGVGFKLIHAFCIKHNLNLKENLFCFLDLVTISIASDIVPIIDENRIIAFYGLKKLKMKPLTGISALLDITDLKSQDITIGDLVFKIGPRINAAGRIETGRNAVKLLISKNVIDAKDICCLVDSNNNNRKILDKNITEEALAMIRESDVLQKRKSTVLYNPDWHKGVVGIVASRVTEHYYKPTIILTKSNDLITGSARSVDDFDLYAAIEKCSHLLENFGGHKYAAGISLKEENLHAFIEQFEQEVANSITDDMLIPKILIDATLDITEINTNFFNYIKRFEPFGPENMTPIFATYNLSDMGNSRVIGFDKSHLKLSINYDNVNIEGIAFGKAYMYETINKKTYNLCYSISENTYNNITKLQLEVKDIKSKF